jgi:UDP-N-acetylmuramate--alanine ligase
MDADGAQFDVIVSPREGGTITFKGLRLPMPGWHNVSNALAAIAVARELDVPEAAIREGLASFGGVKRRFTTTGVAHGVRVIDDYGHHPVEIAAVLRAARQVAGGGRIVAVVQPHRYSRLHDLFKEFGACFNDADTVVVADVYAAGEQPIEGVSKDSLVTGLRAYGHRHAIPLSGPADLPAVIAAETKPGDLVVCLGAGDITAWAYALPGQLEALGAK